MPTNTDLFIAMSVAIPAASGIVLVILGGIITVFGIPVAASLLGCSLLLIAGVVWYLGERYDDD